MKLIPIPIPVSEHDSRYARFHDANRRSIAHDLNLPAELLADHMDAHTTTPEVATIADQLRIPPGQSDSVVA